MIKSIFLGLVLLFTCQVQADTSEEFKATTLAASKGDERQQYNLAHYYANGIGVEKSLPKAIYWYNIAANAKDAGVRYKIGRLYELGIILDLNLEKSFEHYLYSAENGDPFGQTNLSLMYFYGKGTKKNIEQGIYWAEKAASKGFVNAQLNLAMLYNSQTMNVKNKEKSILWYKKAIALNNDIAQFELAKMYLEDKKYDESKRLFELSVANGNTNAMILLAMMYDKALGLARDNIKSLELLKTANELGNKQAEMLLESLRKTKK